jgi:hypothetical protein
VGRAVVGHERDRDRVAAASRHHAAPMASCWWYGRRRHLDKAGTSVAATRENVPRPESTLPTSCRSAPAISARDADAWRTAKRCATSMA